MTTAAYRDDANKIVILNPKGGCGKTTLATNLASYFALRGPPPTLIDTDPIGYTTRWLERRPAERAEINGITRLQTFDVCDEVVHEGKLQQSRDEQDWDEYHRRNRDQRDEIRAVDRENRVNRLAYGQGAQLLAFHGA